MCRYKPSSRRRQLLFPKGGFPRPLLHAAEAESCSSAPAGPSVCLSRHAATCQRCRLAALTPALISHVIRSGCHGNRQDSSSIQVCVRGVCPGYLEPCVRRVCAARPPRPLACSCRKLKDAGDHFPMAELLGKGVLRIPGGIGRIRRRVACLSS